MGNRRERQGRLPVIPELPDGEVLANDVREAAGRERVEPAAVEKDFHLTRLLWALGEALGDRLLLKGGTCLSKVDLGYHRMSEDADFVIPSDGNLDYRGANAKKTNAVRDALKAIASALTMKLRQPGGDVSEKNAHVIWSLEYEGRFPPTTLALEVSLRRVLRTPRKVRLKQLLVGGIADPYREAFCWALDADEVRAEKVRAAFTREDPQIRDFYDLHLLRTRGADFTGKRFIDLVDSKLEELKAKPLSKQPASFGLSSERLDALAGPGMVGLKSVVRADEAAFDVKAAIKEFDRLWGKLK